MLNPLKGVGKALVVVLGVLLVPSMLSIGSIFVERRDVAPGVTGRGIVRVKPGMSVAEVLQILGRPYEAYSYKGSGTHRADSCFGVATRQGVYAAAVTDTLDLAAWLRRATADSALHRCDAGDSRAYDRRATFTYSRPPTWAGRYPMLWVHFDSAAQVKAVFAKQYTPYLFLEEDATIYSLGPDSRSNFSIGAQALVSAFN